jgi:hypothetical protein
MACAGDPGSSAPRDEAAPNPSGGALPVTGMMVSGAVPRSLVPGAPGTLGSQVFVAATPASFPGAKYARLVSSRGDSAIARAFDGGFDPRPVRGEDGDVVTVTVVDSAGRETTTHLPARAKPPRVVRTSPAPNRADVPLNVRVTVVFSTPMDSASVVGAVSLVAQGVEIPGTVELEPNALAAHFTPSVPLAANSDYELRVAGGARDVLGTPLGEPRGVPFRTSADLDPPPPPTLRVVVTVSGEDRDSDFWLADLQGDCRLPSVDWTWFGCVSLSLDVGANLLYLSPGARVFRLYSVAGNCTVSGSAEREVTITTGATAEIAFDVTCTAIPPVSLRVRAMATGVPVPTYFFAETGNHGQCNTGLCRLSWEAAGSYELRAFPGVQEVRLKAPALCRVESQNPVVVNVVAGAVAEVLFQVACVPPGYVRVRVAATGRNILPEFYVESRPCTSDERSDNCFSGMVSNNESLVSPGLRADQNIDIRLPYEASCRVTSANPVQVTPQSNRLIDVSFDVICE